MDIFFLSQQGVSDDIIINDIIQNAVVGNISPKTEGTKTKQLGADKLVTTQICKLKNLMSNNLKVYKLITFLKRLQRLKQEWQKRPVGTRQTDAENLVRFGERERKLAKLSKTTFTYRSSS